MQFLHLTVCSIRQLFRISTISKCIFSWLIRWLSFQKRMDFEDMKCQNPPPTTRVANNLDKPWTYIILRQLESSQGWIWPRLTLTQVLNSYWSLIPWTWASQFSRKYSRQFSRPPMSSSEYFWDLTLTWPSSELPLTQDHHLTVWSNLMFTWPPKIHSTT